ncbi:MAG TPA: tRNA lysidine(34) synthetase TilS [Iamia sp.]|nr:tRNA lysidine(34) synthetase TilS [Iamia sp.]
MSSNPRPELLARCTFPPAGTALTAGVSGGADSLALLVLARAAGCDVTAVHVDHGLRPGSAAEADVVAAAAERYGARFRAERVELADGPDLEARARAARHDVLGPDASTGHTLDDRAETVLLNLLRGAGTTGLSSLRPGPRHPILALRRAETRALCAAEGLTPVEDPSNDDPRFLRTRVRHEVLPLLAEVAGRDLVPVLARQAGLLADDADLIAALAADVDVTDARALAAAPVALARAAVRAWLRPTADGQPPSAAAVARVIAVARGEAVACEVAGGWRVRRSAGRLTLLPPP